MEKLSPNPDALRQDSVFQYKGKVTITLNGRQTSEVTAYLFNNYIVIGKRNVVAIVTTLSKPPLKLLHVWSLRDTEIRKGAKKSEPSQPSSTPKMCPSNCSLFRRSRQL